ncbi:MAG: flavin reductase family protein [Desulfobacterales bacterium]|jgi:flavin reductase (DIM6/NTAB) family NADH-FMN oxidoreductase RutF
MIEEWVNVIQHMTYGIYVLTTSFKAEINGMIASWVSQVSYDPPLIMAAIHPHRYSHHLIEQSGCFALHIVQKQQSDFLIRFKDPDPKSKFSSIQWSPGKTGCPILKDCMAYLECEVKDSYAPGNHTLFIGKIVNARLKTEGTPFSSMDYNGVYLGKS